MDDGRPVLRTGPGRSSRIGGLVGLRRDRQEVQGASGSLMDMVADLSCAAL